MSSCVILLRMFITRLRKLETQNHDARLQTIMVKSTVLAFSGLASSISAIVLSSVSGYDAIAFTDLTVNLVFLYCLFRFGDSLYHRIFHSIDTWIAIYFGMKIGPQTPPLNLRVTEVTKPE